jgi:long-chain acyl-CoA synthetase
MTEFTAPHHTAAAQLTGPGAPFEVEARVRGGYTIKAYKNAEQNLREVMAPGRNFGDAVFVEYREQSWTFTAFFDASDALAGYLQTQCHVESGDRVAIAMRNRPEWLIAFAAIIQCGAVAVPLNSWGKSIELQQGLDDSQSKLVICDAPRLAFIRAAKSATPTLCLDEDSTQAPDHSWSVALSADAITQPVAIDPDEPAIMLFTSGTAGRPKGAIFTHTHCCQSLMNIEFIGAATYMTNTDAMNQQLSSATPPKTLLAVPLFHISGLFSQFIINLRHGRGVYLMYKWDADEALRLVRESGITVIMGAPTMLLDLLNRDDTKDEDFAAIANLSAGGADTPALLHELYRRKAPAGLAGAGWGLTESGGTGAAFTGYFMHERPGASGFPSPIMEFSFRTEDGDCASTGTPGEIWVRSATTIGGYACGDGALEQFEDGWLQTGDIGYIDDEGLLYICGRAKDMVLRGGENIYPSEVEALLLEHPDCIEVAVVALPDETLGEVPGAVLRLSAAGLADENVLTSWCEARMAGYKIPAVWRFTEQPLPRNAVNKLLKPAIKEHFF